jgi:hypothetical protein
MLSLPALLILVFFGTHTALAPTMDIRVLALLREADKLLRS